MNIDNKLHILIVDDYQIIIDGLSSMLDTKHFTISSANDGIAALTILENNYKSIDIVVTDISMPIMDGITLCKTIKHTYPEIKVLMLSMYNSLAYIKDSISADADGYVLKNISQKDFILAIERLSGNGTYFSQDVLTTLISKEKNEKSTKPVVNLTQREIEILKLITMEFTSKEIAEQLFISKQTVDTHRLNLMAKTQSKSLVGLIKYAILEDLVS